MKNGEIVFFILRFFQSSKLWTFLLPNLRKAKKKFKFMEQFLINA